MKYTVTFLPAAEDELAELWRISKDRASVSRSANAIERQLSIDPLNAGESRDSGRRVVFAGPLGFLFRVSAADMLVQVIHVWIIE
jgi:hypothetical protein